MKTRANIHRLKINPRCEALISSIQNAKYPELAETARNTTDTYNAQQIGDFLVKEGMRVQALELASMKKDERSFDSVLVEAFYQAMKINFNYHEVMLDLGI